MILVISTIDREKISLKLISKEEKIFDFKTDDQSRDLLLFIEKTFKKEKISLQNLKAIVINLGPGSYTGIRVGVTVGNILAWSLNIPIFGFWDNNYSEILEKIEKDSPEGFSNPVLPLYQTKL